MSIDRLSTGHQLAHDLTKLFIFGAAVSDLLQPNRILELIITTKGRDTLHMARGSCCSRIFVSRIEAVIRRHKV